MMQQITWPNWPFVLSWLVLWAGMGPWSARAQNPVNYADWRLEWAEEFNTPLDTIALSQRWRFAFPWGRTSVDVVNDGYSTAEALHTDKGVLNMTIRRRATPVLYRGKLLHYDTPMLMSRHLVDSLRPVNCNPNDPGFSYGLFETRVRQPKMDGAAPAFWLFGGAPDELDVFEADANIVTNNVHLVPGNYWRPSRRESITSQNLYYNTDPSGNLHDRFHTYGVAWLPNEVTFYYDGLPIRRETRVVPAGCAMSLILNITAFIWAKEAADTLVVDYVRIYRPRQLPALPAVQRPASNFPQTEQAWLPAEGPPGQLDQASHQTWQLAPVRQRGSRLRLLLIDNYNPAPNRVLPLPLEGEWAPTWYQTWGMPEFQVLATHPDSVQWAVRDLHGRLVASGEAMGGGTWRPRWDMLVPGTYALHLRQGQASVVHPLAIIERPPGSGPSAEWLTPVPAVPAP
jgi:hypothetical protein